MTRLIILDDLGTPPDLSLQGSDMGEAVLLTLASDPELTRQVVEALSSRFSRVRQISAAGLLDDVALSVRESYARLVAAAPDSIHVGGRSLRELLVFEGQFSLWWLNEVFGKRTDLYPTFTRLCQLELIRVLAQEHQIDGCYLLSRDGAFWQVVDSWCRQAGIPLLSPAPRSLLGWWSGPNLVRVLVALLIWMARTTVQTGMAWLMAGQPDLRDRPICAFHTIYPLSWKGAGTPRDEKFAGTPEALAQSSSLAAAYVCTFNAGGHQHVGIGRYWGLLRWLRRWQRDGQGLPIYLLDAYLDPAALLTALGQLSLAFRLYTLERARPFRDHWYLGGIDIFPLLRQEWRAAMKRTPQYLVHMLKVRRFVERVAPAALVYHLFEFGLGRAVAYGARGERNRPVLIAAQEGPIARRKMGDYHWPGELLTEPAAPGDFIANLPLPDWILVEGTGARDRLAEAGYPAQHILVAGAPRVFRLAEIPRWHQRSRPVAGDRKVVLVALGAHDSRPVLAACLPLLQFPDRYQLIVKLHPRGDISSQAIISWLAEHAPGGNYSLEIDDVYRLFPLADVVLGTYSSVAMEAAALGYPVVCLQLPNRIGATPLLDVTAPNVVFVAQPDQLLPTLDHLLRQDPAPGKQLQHLESYFFYRLDGQSAVRWADKISDLVMVARLGSNQEG